MTAYADLTYYKNTYLGTAIADANFPRLALQASAQIDFMTFDRAAAVMAGTDTATIDKIRMATCSVAEQIQTNEQTGGADALTSESLGGYSVSYATGSLRTLTGVQKLAQAASPYLAHTGLMFRGFAPGEYGSDNYNAADNL